ncbi:hypothetical protein AUEXF2481DRAFT_184259 [Aureobasidium subglaciale EXF-2481]|uniref:Uncharacterized protein n=1 Tax=Aureobasidium subglaciale (strain EXF-2481) TaxID=1043005 RepID=A0A074YZL3_AURSE|nr:uncharacterized protein AUEXF2481DRAFT_184259 [Aureobasidium subglaciale EXF-2481]KEQ99577.1 hypothetical protein AUEXF2481DRAFT_184259 [Aureobasidium subglaciale EXF-2481]
MVRALSARTRPQFHPEQIYTSFEYDLESREAKKILTIGTEAAKVAKNLVQHNKIHDLVEKIIETNVDIFYKLDYASAEKGAHVGLEQRIRIWAEEQAKVNLFWVLRDQYIADTIGACKLQIKKSRLEVESARAQLEAVSGSDQRCNWLQKMLTDPKGNFVYLNWPTSVLHCEVKETSEWLQSQDESVA